MRKLEAGVPSANVDAMLQREKDLFVQRHPKSRELAERAKAHWAHGVPMHWMLDWGTPFPIHVASAKGARLDDVDGHSYDDFCFGDTGSMFGHSPEPVARAIAEQAQRGLTYMLPTEDVPSSASLLAEMFGSAVLAGGDHRDRCQPLCASAGAAPSPNGRRSWCSTAAITAPPTTPSCG
jgi:glutamate-1-semialdehyde 2,1-aminomutase